MRKENKISLIVDKSISRLYGYELGEEIYIKQVKNKVDYNQINIIEFPDNIENVALSFVQGFCADIFANIQPIQFENYFKIEGKERLKEKFKKAVLF